MKASAYMLVTSMFMLQCMNIPAQTIQSSHSQLWGRNGENWNHASRLPDFSYAGYERGEKQIPNVPKGVNIRQFGAKGDGNTDDTKAFQIALQEVQSGAIEVPPGKYVITDFLEINRPGVVLRGAGPEKTILYCPTPLNDIKPNWGATTSGRRTSNYSWSSGFVQIRGGIRSTLLTKITGNAKRGSRRLQVSDTSKLKAGQEIQVYQKDLPDNSLAIHLYSDDSGPVDKLKGRARTVLTTRITVIDGNIITLERPLRCDVRSQWNPQIRSFQPTVTGSGIENIGFEFPVTAYKGHFTELGLNALAFRGAAHCWVRNIRIDHADSGLFIDGFFNTIEGIVFESARPLDNQQCTGHHGISLGGGDNLLSRFHFGTRFIHDTTLSGFCSGNVIMDGSGIDLSLDHHRKAPYSNLFTNLDAGNGNRLWKCGGGAALGKHCGMHGTFWSIESKNPLAYPRPDFGPASMNLVGLRTDQASEMNPNGKWFESIPPTSLKPKNLYRAQLDRRLAH